MDLSDREEFSDEQEFDEEDFYSKLEEDARQGDVDAQLMLQELSKAIKEEENRQRRRKRIENEAESVHTEPATFEANRNIVVESKSYSDVVKNSL